MITVTQSTFMVLSLWASFAWPAEANAARLVTASISLDGKTLLKGSTGDNGRVDADGVWEHLKSIRFKATKQFLLLKVDPNAKRIELSGNQKEGRLDTIIVHINHGGRAMTRKLKLVRGSIDKQGREWWSLDPAEVDKLFDDRLIRRSDAARLNNPRNSKR